LAPPTEWLAVLPDPESERLISNVIRGLARTVPADPGRDGPSVWQWLSSATRPPQSAEFRAVFGGLAANDRVVPLAATLESVTTAWKNVPRHALTKTEITMSPLKSLGIAVLWLVASMSTTWAADEPKSASPETGPAEASPAIDQAELEKKFAENLSGVVFSGSYSVTTRGEEKPAQMEKYTIQRVSKVKDRDDYWLFAARIQYGKNDLTVPLTLQVKWAGDTPVITLTDLTIPGLGTFTSRVMIYGDRYAGTWQHDKTGGHLWGKIEKIDKPEAPGAPDKKDR
jgi:hypothetical protein